MFEVATDTTQGTPDTVYGTNVIYERLGLINDIRINDTFNSSKFQYVEEGVIIEKPIRQYHLHKYAKGSTNLIKLNNWQKHKVVDSQKIIRTYESNIKEQFFEIDHYNDMFFFLSIRSSASKIVSPYDTTSSDQSDEKFLRYHHKVCQQH